MKSQHIRMSIEEFEIMSYPFGWKAEYWDNHAHLSPREHIVKTRVVLEPQALIGSFNLMPVKTSFKEQMIEAFFESFRDSVEFCDWPENQIRLHAQKNINGYFQGSRGKPLSASVIVMRPNMNQVVGLALFLENREGHTKLDLLYVVPSYQRKGIATQMVAHAANILYDEGVQTLYSAYHICNEGSHDWQHSYGFLEIPDQFYCRLKYAWFRHEIWRREKLGIEEGVCELETERDRWYEQLTDDWRY